MADDSKMDDEVFTLKTKGNQSMRTGGYGEAVHFYTQAIAMAPGNHVLYSNRALAYVKMGKHAEALADADKCISIDPSFVKAYSTKGVALTWLGRTDDARAAYVKGLELQPDHPNMKANLASLRSTPARASAPAASGGVVQFLTANRTKTLQFGARMFMLVNMIGYIIPLFSAGFSYMCYRRVLMACMAHYLVIVVMTHGRPKFSMAYAGEVFKNSATHFLFMSLMFFTARPRALAFVPLVGLELVHLAEYLYNLSLFLSPALAGSLARMGNSWGRSLSGNTNFASLGYSAKWKAVAERVMQFSALGEVLLGISLIVELFTPIRNILLLFMFWQMLQVRYIASPYVKMAFGQVDGRILSLTQHRLCPGIVNTLYSKLRGFLASRVAPPAPGTQPQRPSCTIM